MLPKDYTSIMLKTGGEGLYMEIAESQGAKDGGLFMENEVLRTDGPKVRRMNNMRGDGELSIKSKGSSRG